MTELKKNARCNGMRRPALTALLATFLAASSVGLQAAPAEAYVYRGSHWGVSNLNLNVNATSQDARTAINQASDEYTIKTDVNITNTSAYSAWAAENIDYGRTGWEGITSTTQRGEIIENAQTRLNNYYLSGQPVSRLKVVWLHEIGHSLALDHVNNVKQCMWKSASESYITGGVRNLTNDEIYGISLWY